MYMKGGNFVLWTKVHDSQTKGNNSLETHVVVVKGYIVLRLQQTEKENIDSGLTESQPVRGKLQPAGKQPFEKCPSH